MDISSERDCNCVRPSPGRKVIVPPTPMEEEDMEATSDDTLDDTLVTDVSSSAIEFRIRGSTYHPSYQMNLKSCRKLMCSSPFLQCKLCKDPTNPVYSNAISVNVHLNGEVAQIGYVPRGRIRKITEALVYDNILEANLVRVTS